MLANTDMVIQGYLRDQCQGLAQVAQVLGGPQISFSAGFHGSPNLLVSVLAPPLVPISIGKILVLMISDVWPYIGSPGHVQK